MDEKEAIKKVQSGETGAFREIIEKYQKPVYSHCRGFLRNEQEAEDASQEVFVNVFKSIKRFRGDSKLGTWIYRITANVCKNKLKQLKRLNAPLIDDASQNEEGETVSIVERVKEKEEKEPDREFASKSASELISRRIAELTDEQKQVIMLRDVEGRSYEEIARIMRLTVSAVKSKLFRARENLRDTLKRDEIL